MNKEKRSDMEDGKQKKRKVSAGGKEEKQRGWESS
jgi:hypothetical protein